MRKRIRIGVVWLVLALGIGAGFEVAGSSAGGGMYVACEDSSGSYCGGGG